MNNLRLYAKILLFVFSIFIFFIYSNSYKNKSSTDGSVIISRLKEIKKMEVLQAEVFSYKTYEESSLLGFNNDKFSVIETGKAIYGIDFDKGLSITSENNSTNKNIKVELPPVEIFELVVNPNSIEFIGLEKGFFTSQQKFEDAKQEVAVELYNNMKIKANNKGNLAQAEKAATSLIYSIFKTLGYNNIEITFKKVNQRG